MFNYEFMRLAFYAGIMLAIIIPILGFNITIKNLSMTGDALSHTALAGVAIGLVMGASSPLIVALIVCVVANVIIDLIRKKYPRYADVSIGIIFSLAIGIAGVLSKFSSPITFSSYLFGSIATVSKSDVIICAVLFAVIIVFYFIFSKQIFYTQYNERDAKISGINTSLINLTMTTLTAMVVAISSKIIGSLIVSSLLILPVVTSMLICKGYKNTILFSIIISVASTIIGIILSWEIVLNGQSLPSGSTIVIVAGIIYLVTICVKGIKRLAFKIKAKTTTSN